MSKTIEDAFILKISCPVLCGIVWCVKSMPQFVVQLEADANYTLVYSIQYFALSNSSLVKSHIYKVLYGHG